MLCRINVGTRTAGSTWRTSISMFMRIKVVAAAGLALDRNQRAHHCR